MRRNYLKENDSTQSLNFESPDSELTQGRFAKYFNLAFKIFASIFMLSSVTAQSQCTYTLEMSDTFGDGWNTSTMDVTVGTTTTNVTLPTGTFASQQFTGNQNDALTLNFLGGGIYDNEISFVLKDTSGAIVYSSGQNPFIGVHYNSAFCPSCLTGGIDSAINITMSSAELFFSTNLGTLANFEYGQAGFSLGSGLMVNNIPDSVGSYNFTGLYAGFDYHFYMQDSCIGNGKASWVGPYVVSIPQSAGASLNTATYSSGDISTEFAFPTFGTSFSACSDTLSITIPTGNFITGVNISYDMTAPAAGGGYMSEQQSYVFEANSGNTEPAFYTGVGTGGTYSYNRTGITAFNGVSSTGQLDFVMNAFRTWEGTPGCNDLVNKVDNNTWTISVTSAPSPSCFAPDDVSISNTANTADVTISDTTNTGATYRILYGPSGFVLGTGSTLLASGVGTHALSNIQPDNVYDVYVQTICSSTDSAILDGPYSFSTLLGKDCSVPNLISGLPYFQDSLTTDGYGDDFDNTDACNNFYMNGDDYVFSYTAAQSNIAEIILTNTGTWVGVFVTDACPSDPNATCVAQATSTGGNPTISSVLFEAGKTYYITVSTNPAPQFTPFDIAINVLPDEAAITAITNPINPVSAGFASVEVDVDNLGGSPITSLSFGYTKNGVNQAPTTITLSPGLAPGADTTLTIGGTNFPTTPTDLTAYISNVNGAADGNQNNDTVSARFCGPISGTFTVGGAGATFATLNDAVAALDCGINGPIVFNINPGTYNEAISIPEVVGASATNTITFDGGSAATTTITWNSNVDVPTVELNGADYVTIKNLTIEAAWTSSDNWCVFLTNQADWNTIEDCELTMPTSTISDRASINVSANRFYAANTTLSQGNNANHLTIRNNVMRGGYYGLSMRGTSTTSRLVDVVMENNDIEAYYYGVYTYYVDTLNLKGNVINSHSNPTTHYSVYTYYNDGAVMESNTITSTDNGIFTFSVNGHRYVNNMISAGSDRGIYLNANSNATILHNSVLGQPGLEISSSSSTGLNIQNNIFASDNDLAFETNSADSASFSNLDYNLYFSQASPALEMGNTAYGSLLAWQNAYPTYNANSVEGDPLFNSSTDLHITFGILADSAGTPVGIIKDIDGEGRYFLAPDMGADEYTPITSDLELLSDVSFNTCKNGSDSITFYVVNQAQTAIDFSVDNFSLNVNVTGAAASTATISVNSGVVNPGDSIVLTATPIVLNVSGAYNIDAYLTSSWDIVNENDSLFGATYNEVAPVNVSPDTVINITDGISLANLSATTPFGTQVSVNFWAASFAGGFANNKLFLDVFDGTNWNTEIFSFERNTVGNGNPWEFFSVDITPYTTSGSVKVRFNVANTSNTFYDDIIIDDVEIVNAATGAILLSETFDNTTIPSGWTDTGNDAWRFVLSGLRPEILGTGISEHTGNNGSWAWVDASSPQGATIIGRLETPTITIPSGNPVWWSEAGVAFDSTFAISAGPFTVADNGLKEYVFTINSPCGTFSDTGYVNVNIIPDEVAVGQILGTDGGCAVDTAYYSAEICNNGANGYQNLPVFANLDGFIFSDTLDTLAPYTCDTVMFSTAISILSADSIFNNLSIYVNVIGDVDNTNDTSGFGPIVYTSAPAPPITMNDTSCDGNAMLTASALENIFWYDSLVGGNIVGIGDTLQLSGLNGNDTAYAQVGGNLSASLNVGYPAGNGSSGNYFKISLNNALQIDGFDVNNTGTGALTYEVWYRPGDYVGNFGSNAGWTAVSTTIATTGAGAGNPTLVPLPSPLQLGAGDWSFAVFTTSGVQYTNGNTVGNVWASDNYITIYEGHGFGTAFDGSSFSPRNFNGAINYSIPSPCFNPNRTMAVAYNNTLSIDSVNSADQSTCGIIDGTIDVFASDFASNIGGALQYSIDGGNTFATSGSFSALGQNTNGYDVVVTDGFCSLNGPNVTIVKPGTPSVPVMPANVIYCEGEMLMPLFIDSAGQDSGVTQIKWYSDASLSALTQIGVDTIIPIDTAATITYYATQVLPGCEGPAGSVDVTLIPTPAAPIVNNDTTNCFGSPLDLSGNVAGFTPSFYTEDFQAGTGGWTGVGSPLWTRLSSTPTSTNTGPAGGSGVNRVPTLGNFFMYIETSGGGVNAISTLTGPGFNLEPNSVLEFDYHMFGATINTLSVEVLDGTNWVQVWTISGQQQTSSPSPYLGTVVSLAGFSGPSNIRFLGQRGTSFSGDIAIDNILVYNSQPQAIWALDNQFTSVIDTNTTITALDSVGSLTYFAYYIDDATGCQSMYDSVVVTKLNAPSTPTVANQVYCDGDSITPLTITGAGGTYNVYTDMMLNNSVASNVSGFTTPLNGPGYAVYYVTEVNSTGCESPSSMASVTINTVPASANLGADKNYCQGDSILALTAGNIPGTTLNWYSDAAGTTLLGTGSFQPANTVGTTSYYAALTNGLCSGPIDSVKVTINAIPSIPAVSGGAAYCNGDLITDLTVTGVGSTFNWYNDAALNNLVGTGASYSPSTSIGSVTYYAVETANGCESPSADSAMVIVYSNPSITSVTSDSASTCSATDGYIIINATGGNGPYLYSTNNGTTTQVGDSIGGLAPGNYTPYVEDSLGCSDMGQSVAIFAPGQPNAPSILSGPGTYCSGAAYTALKVVDTSAAVYTWYYDAALTTVFMTGDSVMPADSIGSITYYVTETANGCEGPTSTVTVNINPIPVAPTGGSDLTFCLGQTVGNVSATAVSNGTLRWYSNSGLTTLVGTGASTAAGSVAILPGTYTFYVTETTTGCESAYDSVNVTINPIPNIPNAGMDMTYCNGDMLMPLVGAGSGGTLNWYSNANLTSNVGSGDTLVVSNLPVATTSYWLAETNSFGCEGNSDKVSVIVRPTPVMPSIVNVMDYCDYETVGALTAAGGNGTFTWYNNYTTALTGMSVTPPSTIGMYNFMLTETNGFGCESDTAMNTVNVFQSPSIDSLTIVDVTGGCADSTGSITVLASGGDSAYSYFGNIYGMPTANGSNSTFGNLPAGTYDSLYVVDGNGCVSGTDLGTVAAPGQPTLLEMLSANGVYCFGDNIADLVAADTSASTGGVVEWYSDAALNNLLGTGDTIAANTNVGVRTYYAIENNVGCKGPATSVMVTVNALPATPNASANVQYCDGESINDVTVAGAGGTYTWYSDAALTSMFAMGDTVSPTISTPGTETLYVVETNANSCTSAAADNVTITIDTLPTVMVAALADICANGGTVQLTGNMPMGGTWSADSGLTSGGVIDPVAIGGANTYNVVYTYTDGNGCTEDDTAAVTINPEPSVTFTGLSNLCIDGAPFAVSGGAPLGGSYSGTGVDSTGTFDPAVAGSGNSVITYNYTDANNCSSSNTDTVTVNALPTANAGNAQTICFGDTVTLTATGGANYVWSNGPSVASQDVSPANTVNYGVLVTDANGCTNTDSVMVNVNQLPTVAVNSNSSVCDGAAPAPFFTTSPASGGTYSGTGIIDPVNGVFSPNVGAGSYVITYAFTDGNGCSNMDTTTMVVDTLPTVTFATPANICEGSGPVNLTGGLPATGGSYSGTAVTGGSFDPAAAGGAGTYNLNYTYTDGNGCANSVNSTITVDTLPNITWTAFNDLCDNAPAIALTEAVPAGGSYSGTGVSGGQFDPMAAGGAGNYSISYDFTDGNGCSSTDAQSITVNPSPIVDLGSDTTLCNNIPTITLDGGSGVSYVWSLDGTTLANATQTINVDGSTGSGTYKVVVTNAFGCEGEDEMVVNYNEICASVNTTFGDDVSVTYYPNPTNGMLNVDVTGLVGQDITLSVTNMHGQSVFNTTIENAPSNLRDVIDLSTEASGVYFIRLTAGDRSFVERISLR